MSYSNNNNNNKSLPIPLSHLPLRPSTLALLQKRGFTTWQEIQDATKSNGGSMSNLQAELAVDSMAHAASLYREIQGCVNSVGGGGGNSSGGNGVNLKRPLSASASELLSNPAGSSSSSSTMNSSIITFSRTVDQLLGGGIRLGELTELHGCPGCGKTQLAMQLAVNATLPLEFGGVQGQAIYIDTEGSFSPERCHDMATALVQHIATGAARNNNNNRGAVPPWFTTPESILQRIHVYRVHDLAAQTALLQALPSLTTSTSSSTDNGDDDKSNVHTIRGPIRLVIVDSMAFHCRAQDSTTTDFVERTRLLTRLATGLAEFATQQNAAVLVVNQMTTKLVNNSSNNNNSARMVPALGESWAHAVTTRIKLSMQNSNSNVSLTTNNNSSNHQHATMSHYNRRTLQLVKSPRLPSGAADFVIVQQGIRGTDYVEKKKKKNQPQHQQQQGRLPHDDASYNNHNNNKRLRPC